MVETDILAIVKKYSDEGNFYKATPKVIKLALNFVPFCEKELILYYPLRLSIFGISEYGCAFTKNRFYWYDGRSKGGIDYLKIESVEVSYNYYKKPAGVTVNSIYISGDAGVRDSPLYKILKDILDCNKLVKARDHEKYCRYEEAAELYYELKMYGAQKKAYAKLYEASKRWDEAAKMYDSAGMNEDKERAIKEHKLQTAKKYEDSLRMEDAAKLYEELEMWKEAGRVRELLLKKKSQITKITGNEVHLGDRNSIYSTNINDHSTNINKNTIKDSVIQRSTIGGNSKKKILICPYCGEELIFPEIPKFCPYCRKQILM